MASRQWTWLITDDSADLADWLSPDGALLLVEHNDDGASVLSLRDAASGEPLRDLPLPAPGCITDARLPRLPAGPGRGPGAGGAVGRLVRGLTPGPLSIRLPGTWPPGTWPAEYPARRGMVHTGSDGIEPK